MRRTCKCCHKDKVLNALNFKENYNDNRKYYYHTCRKCYNKIEQLKRIEGRKMIYNNKVIEFPKQELMGYKKGPYFVGENYEYIPPTYEEIKKEYCL